MPAGREHFHHRKYRCSADAELSARPAAAGKRGGPYPFTLDPESPLGAGRGWSFSVALLGILLAHEAGHFFFCRRHGIRSSLPYVLPAPTLSGTAGAVIRIRSRIPTRRALIEVGIAGPIAGYLVALPTTIVGILLSRPASAPPALIQFHQPLTVTFWRGCSRPGFPECRPWIICSPTRS